MFDNTFASRVAIKTMPGCDGPRVAFDCSKATRSAPDVASLVSVPEQMEHSPRKLRYNRCCPKHSACVMALHTVQANIRGRSSDSPSQQMKQVPVSAAMACCAIGKAGRTGLSRRRRQDCKKFPHNACRPKHNQSSRVCVCVCDPLFYAKHMSRRFLRNK